jgi:hypothetical protein
MHTHTHTHSRDVGTLQLASEAVAQSPPIVSEPPHAFSAPSPPAFAAAIITTAVALPLPLPPPHPPPPPPPPPPLPPPAGYRIFADYPEWNSPLESYVCDRRVRITVVEMWEYVHMGVCGSLVVCVCVPVCLCVVCLRLADAFRDGVLVPA